MSRKLKRPPRIITPGIEIPENPESMSLKNGTRLLVFPSNNTELVRLDLIYDAGLISQSKPLQAHLTSLMLTEGTLSRNAEEIGELFDFYGTIPDIQAGPDYSSVRILMLPTLFRAVAELTREIVANSIFPENELKTHITNEREKFITSRRRASVLSFDHFLELLFGKNHPLGVMTDEKHFNEISRDDLLSFHEMSYKNAPSIIALSGNVTNDIIAVTTELFEELPHKKSLPDSGYQWQISSHNENPAEKRTVPMPGALQSSINIGMRSNGIDHPDFPARKVVNTIAGGYFGSRLMQSLREKHGFTYGVQSFIIPVAGESVMAVATEVGQEFTKDAIKAIYYEFDRLSSSPVGLRELKLVKNSMMGSMTRKFDGPFARCSSYLFAERYNMDMSYYSAMKETIINITPDEIKRVAKTYYNSNNMYEVATG